MSESVTLRDAARELAGYASYSEIVGGIGHNRAQIRKWCDHVFEALRAEEGKGGAHRILEAADTPGSIGPGDVALTIAWSDGTETVEHVSENAAAVLGYRYDDGDESASLQPVEA